MGLLSRIRQRSRPIFHWKYSSVLIPLFFATGIGMALANRFAMAYIFFVLFGLWSAGYWLTSDVLRKKADLLRERNIRRNRERFEAETTKYRRWIFVPSLGIVGLTLVFLCWTRIAQLQVRADEQKAERDDVFNRLSVQPIDVSAGPQGDQQVLVGITNNGRADIDNHTVRCVVRSLLSMNNMRFGSGGTAKVQEFAQPLLGSGRGETIACSTLIDIGPHSMACIGMDIVVSFGLVDQPEEKMDKSYRWSYSHKRQTPWTQDSSKDAAWDPCAGFPDIKESNENAPLHARIVISPKPGNKALPEPLSDRRPLRLNFLYENDGNEAAKTYLLFEHSWIVEGNPASAAVQNEVWQEFIEYMRKTKKLHSPANDLEPDISYWSTSDPQPITNKQIESIKSGRKHIFLTVAMPFKDSRGSHIQESCMYIQTPADPESPWHPCNFHHSEIDSKATMTSSY